MNTLIFEDMGENDGHRRRFVVFESDDSGGCKVVVDIMEFPDASSLRWIRSFVKERFTWGDFNAEWKKVLPAVKVVTALLELKAQGIKPTMTAEELMALTRGED